jgi:cell fate (sporulation/competence/biofilm development) regulator YlbF (YheA/YmcA/DUF963 family)
MHETIQLIIEKAKELSNSIKNLEVTRNYNDMRVKLNSDRNALELYAKLVLMGKEINARLASGGIEENNRSYEHGLLQRELEQNPLVKEYIRAQREYLDLLKKVIERIKHPG